MLEFHLTQATNLWKSPRIFDVESDSNQHESQDHHWDANEGRCMLKICIGDVVKGCSNNRGEYRYDEKVHEEFPVVK